MKFGQNLYLRSVPQWSYYNVDYNGLKALIKTRTSNPPTEPVFIPGQGRSSDTWHSLEDELFPILREEHEKPAAFIKSKYGEIERRLADLTRRVEELQQNIAANPGRQRIQQSRRYQKLVQDADGLSEDIQALARFANTQRQAVRKILKKYEKWTHSPGLRLRVDKELLNRSDHSLHPDLDPQLRRLAKASAIIKQIPNTSGVLRNKTQNAPKDAAKFSARALHEAVQQSSSTEVATAFASVPLGKSAGRATYWIHLDNMEEARVLLLRHMKPLQQVKESLSRVASNDMGVQRSATDREHTGGAQFDRQNVALFDNLDRFAREQSGATIGSSEVAEGHVPTRIALSGWWGEAADACVVMSDISPAASASVPHRLTIRRKELPLALIRDAATSQIKKSVVSSAIIATQDYLTQHRDVKPLAQIQSIKSLFAGITNSAEVGSWATLETNVIMSKFDASTLGQTFESSGEQFPYGVLEIRWEFSPIPEVVRAFDSSYVVERVRGFSLEAHTVYTMCKPDMPQPLWMPLLDKDIRKVPLSSVRQGKRRAGNVRVSIASSALNTSGPSSTEGPSDSVFSLPPGPSSATSANSRDISSPGLSSPQKPKFEDPPRRKKKQAPRRLSNQPVQRYWNEFDDGSELEDNDYAIYVNPDEPFSLPGAETVSKVFSAMYQSMSKGKRHALSMFSLHSKDSATKRPERQPLLRRQSSSDQDIYDSSGSDLEPLISPFARRRTSKGAVFTSPTSGRPLSARRQARETALFRSYVGLLLLSYILLVMSTILKATGRRKAVFEVDAGVISGVVAAEACGIIALGLLCMRKKRTITVLHQIAVGLAFAVVAIAGTVLMVSVAVGRPGKMFRNGSIN